MTIKLRKWWGLWKVRWSAGNFIPINTISAAAVSPTSVLSVGVFLSWTPQTSPGETEQWQWSWGREATGRHCRSFFLSTALHFPCNLSFRNKEQSWKETDCNLPRPQSAVSSLYSNHKILWSFYKFLAGALLIWWFIIRGMGNIRRGFPPHGRNAWTAPTQAPVALEATFPRP